MEKRICAEKYLPREENIVKQMYHNTNQSRNLRAAFITQKQWPENSTITIGFYPVNNPNLQWTPIPVLQRGGKMDPIENEIRNLSPSEAVKKVITERIQPIVGLNLVFTDVYNANVRIGFANDGAWSFVGTDILQQPANMPTMNFGWLDAATIMHEFGHALGMIHEHQNPRGETIPWDVNAVYKWAAETQGWDRRTTDTNILEHYSVDTTNGSGFDPESIMLYFFPGTLTTTGKGTDQNVRLSETDVFWLNKHYPNSKLTPEQFYEKAYNEDINSPVSPDSNETDVVEPSSASDSDVKDIFTNVGAVLGIVALILLFIGFAFYIKNSNKSSNVLSKVTVKSADVPALLSDNSAYGFFSGIGIQ